MNREEFLRQLENALELPALSLREDQLLVNIKGWDSLAVVTCMSFVDERFGLLLAPDDINKAQTAGDLVALLGDNVRE